MGRSHEVYRRKFLFTRGTPARGKTRHFMTGTGVQPEVLSVNSRQLKQ